MYKIGLKLWSCNTDYYFDEAIRLYNQNIYDYIELYVVPDTIDTLSKWEKMNIPFIIHNAHFAHGFNLAKRDHEKRNREIYEQTVRFADSLNARYIIFHGGIDGSIQETIRQLFAFNESRALIENKPFVALPNKMGGRFCRGATIEEISLIVKNVKCGFCLDIGHAICSANSQKKEPYAFVREMLQLKPKMFHLSDIGDMTSIYDAHPHLGTGKLDIAKLKENVFPENAIISIETNKENKKNLNDYIRDVEYLEGV